MTKDEIKELIKESADMANSVYKGVTCSGEQALDYFKAVLDCNVEALFEQSEPPKEPKMEESELSKLFRIAAGFKTQQEEEASIRFAEIHNSPDAREWAQYFCHYNPAVDESYMIGWFANAMMAMHDHIHRINHIIPKCECCKK